MAETKRENSAGREGVPVIYSEKALAEAGVGERREAKKYAGRVGRNEPCPCGSGRKYKKCCGVRG